MANTITCDRCAATITEKKHTAMDGDKVFDLCPDCKKDFELFMKEKQGNNLGLGTMLH